MQNFQMCGHFLRYGFALSKGESKLTKHGLSLSFAQDLEWDTAMVSEDTRKHYAETRFQATGYIGYRLCVMMDCQRAGSVRVISLRSATAERKNDVPRLKTGHMSPSAREDASINAALPLTQKTRSGRPKTLPARARPVKCCRPDCTQH